MKVEGVEEVSFLRNRQGFLLVPSDGLSTAGSWIGVEAFIYFEEVASSLDSSDFCSPMFPGRFDLGSAGLCSGAMVFHSSEGSAWMMMRSLVVESKCLSADPNQALESVGPKGFSEPKWSLLDGLVCSIEEDGVDLNSSLGNGDVVKRDPVDVIS